MPAGVLSSYKKSKSFYTVMALGGSWSVAIYDEGEGRASIKRLIVKIATSTNNLVKL